MKTKTLDSTKIYWLDKEETVKAKLVGLDLPHGFGSTKYTFRVIYGGSGDIVYMDSNLPKTIHEVVEQKPWQFTTPIAMKCREEQFNGIKDRLVEMGYIFYGITFGEKYRYLCTGYASDNKCVTDLGKISLYFKQANPMVFETFNPDLFLALAAMTDKEYGIKGEVYTNSCGKFYTKDDEKEGKWHNTFFRKATAQEIIEHFEKKEFVLPENFKVRRNRENYSEINGYAKTISNENFNNGEGFVYFYNGSASTIKSNCSEITSDQFKKYVLKETTQSCPKEVGKLSFEINIKDPFCSTTNSVTYSHDSNIGSLFGQRTLPNYLGGIIHMSSTPTETKTIIPIPPAKQATLFDDRVEITDWEPKEGDVCHDIYINQIGEIMYSKVGYVYNKMYYKLKSGFLVRTESEAKSLIEKLKQAML